MATSTRIGARLRALRTTRPAHDDRGTHGVRLLFRLAAVALVAASLTTAPPAARVAAVTTCDPASGIACLHNATADSSTSCPTTTDAWWHFVLAPNSGTYSITAITLNIGGTMRTFTGAAIVLNAGQHDNVFVQVPSGATVASLSTSGSYATFTPPGENVKFNLSHTCTPHVTCTTTTTTTTTTTSTTTTSTTTTSTTTSTTTTTLTPTTTTTTGTSTTTTLTPTTTTLTPTTTTVAPTTTITVAPTTTIVQQEPPVTTVPTILAATSTVPTSVLSETLPRTGGDVSLLIVLGVSFVLIGLVLAAVRRTTT